MFLRQIAARPMSSGVRISTSTAVEAACPSSRSREIQDVYKRQTYADVNRFFSYRRSTHRAEADYGRHVHAIALA